MPPGRIALRLTSEFSRLFSYRREGGVETSLNKRVPFETSPEVTWDSLVKDNDFGLSFFLARPPNEISSEYFEFYTDNLNHIRKNGFQILGQTVDLKSIPAWGHDFSCGVEWPRAHYGKVPIILDKDLSDIKVPWEMSRLQWLIPVVQSYYLNDDEFAEEVVFHTLNDWLHQNKTGWGVDWVCTIEPSIRVVVLIWIYSLLSHKAFFDKHQIGGTLLKSIYLHCEFIRKNLEISDINGNHLTSNLCALVICGSFFQKGCVADWSKMAWCMLEDEIQKQVTPDGVSFEGSTSYHCFVAEMMLFAAAAARYQDLPVSKIFEERLFNMSTFIDSFLTPDKKGPNIGDGDDAGLLPLVIPDCNQLELVSALIKIFVGQNHSASCIFDNVGFWLPRFKAKYVASNICFPEKSKIFVDSGVSIFRHKSSYVFFKAGPLSLGGRGGHEHNDTLSVVVYLQGAPIFIDAGTGEYTRHLRRRNEFRKTSSHNTPLVIGQEINDLVGIWELKNNTRRVITKWKSSEDLDECEGTHNGFRGYRHDERNIVRRIQLNKKTDTFYCQDLITLKHFETLNIPFLLSPDATIIEKECGSYLIQNFGKMFSIEITSSNKFTSRVEKAICSPSYGVYRDTHRLNYEIKGEGSIDFALTVKPQHN